MNDLSFDLASLRARYAEGLDPVAVVELVYARIGAAGDPGIFISLLPLETARAMARALGPFDPSKPLWGAPFAIKDNIDLAGLPTTAACPAFAHAPAESAACVQALVDAGALPIGKTNLDQFATGLVGVRSPYPPPKNAFDPAIVPGGSSSGSGVAVARGLVSFALGTDTAGSGRVPAALNNVVGLKPSLGAVSIRGVVPACKSLDCVSIFACCVADAWDVLRAMAVEDGRDPFQRPLSFADVGAAPPALKLGVPRAEDLEFFGDDNAAAAWRAALAVLKDMGAAFVEVDMRPLLAAAKLLYDGPWVAERHAALRAFLATNAADVLPVTRGIIEEAKRYSATDAFDAAYEMRGIAQYARAIERTYDMLVVPSIPGAPTVADLERDPLTPNARLGRWTNFVNLLDMSALAVPGPFRPDGFPAGVTLIGPRGADARLAAVGDVFHARSGVGMGKGRLAPPSLPPGSTTPADWIELVVVGAHLSGMALNRELTELGAQFARAVKTEPCYRFHALAGGPPKRPGLIRCAAGEGVAIETEVWSLSPAAFGRFVAGIPAPLGIGVIALADGTRPKGFLAEPEGLVGARDIGALGGWRAFIAAS